RGVPVPRPRVQRRVRREPRGAEGVGDRASPPGGRELRRPARARDYGHRPRRDPRRARLQGALRDLVLEIVSGELRFVARLEEEAAPETVAAFRRLLPLESRLIHARWSGEACWTPFGELDVGLAPENATSYPAPGQILFYPGGVSETEILFPYG